MTEKLATPQEDAWGAFAAGPPLRAVKHAHIGAVAEDELSQATR